MIPAGTAWKTSCYVWLDGLLAGSDLHDERHELSGREIGLLAELRAAPATLGGIAARLAGSADAAAELLDGLVARRLVVPADEDEGRRFAVKRVDIEVSSHCNARCRFCPQSLDPRPRHVMDMDLFARIAGEIAPYRPEWVALNHFSEPLMDPRFAERCRVLAAHDLKLSLFTNASVLTPRLSAFLAESGVLFRVTVNFPSTDPQEWARLMGLPVAAYRQTERNLLALAEAWRGSLVVSVNGCAEDHHGRTGRVAALLARYPHVAVAELPSHTLAGHIQGDLVGPPIFHSGARLGGCTHARPAGHLHISSRGEVYICSLDYAQKAKFGSLAGSSLAEVLGGARAASYRRQVYGLEDAAPDLLCRQCWNARPGAAPASVTGAA